jgi:threonine synthase
MDIQAASNFERYLYYLMNCDTAQTKALMIDFLKSGKLDLSDQLDQIQRDFLSTAVSEDAILKTIRCFKQAHDYTLDPHTAIGVHAALEHKTEGIPMICLATAHPAKFGKTVAKATGTAPIQPAALEGIENKGTRCELMDADIETIKQYLKTHARHLP